MLLPHLNMLHTVKPSIWKGNTWLPSLTMQPLGLPIWDRFSWGLFPERLLSAVIKSHFCHLHLSLEVSSPSKHFLDSMFRGSFCYPPSCFLVIITQNCLIPICLFAHLWGWNHVQTVKWTEHCAFVCCFVSVYCTLACDAGGARECLSFISHLHVNSTMASGTGIRHNSVVCF